MRQRLRNGQLPLHLASELPLHLASGFLRGKWLRAGGHDGQRGGMDLGPLRDLSGFLFPVSL